MIRLALFEPDIAGNVGACMRLCACLQAPLEIIEPCGFIFDDKRLKRAGMDYLDHLDWRRHASWERFLEWRAQLSSSSGDAEHRAGDPEIPNPIILNMDPRTVANAPAEDDEMRGQETEPALSQLHSERSSASWKQSNEGQETEPALSAASSRRLADRSGKQDNRLLLFTTKGAVPYTDFHYQPGDILLMGKESAGAPDYVHAAADARLTIPMNPAVRSLNLSTAAAMALGEARRQLAPDGTLL